MSAATIEIEMPIIWYSPFGAICALIFGIQWGVYLLSTLWKTEKYFDVTGSGTFLLLTFLSYHWSMKSSRQQIQSGMIVLWAIRLGFYLFVRILKSGRDRRFNKVRDNPGMFFCMWTLQGVWILLTLMPTFMLMLKTRDVPLNNRDYFGYSLWLIGFIIEAIADYQKSRFRNDPRNQGRFITSGLWSWSRHPNYLGEILLWFGLYLSASSVFVGRDSVAVLCPIFDMLLITKLSGIPPLEEFGIRKWGTDPKYIAYLRNTAVLIPYIW